MARRHLLSFCLVSDGVPVRVLMCFPSPQAGTTTLVSTSRITSASTRALTLTWTDGTLTPRRRHISSNTTLPRGRSFPAPEMRC